MTTQDGAEGSSAWALAEAEARKRQAFLRQFPGGVAPYTPRNLIAFGCFGGIVGAGIAGVVNLNRLRQPRRIPILLLLTFVLLLIGWCVAAALLDWSVISFPQVDARIFTLVVILSAAVLGIVFACLIALSQRVAWRRWRDLAGRTVQTRGSFMAVLALWLLAIVLTVSLLAVWNTLFLNMIFQTLYPQQRYTARNISVTVPAGWAQVHPERTFVTCDPPAFTCLAVLSERSTDSDVEFVLINGTHPKVYSDSLAVGIHKAHPSFPTLTSEAYTDPMLDNRVAYSFEAPLNGRSFIVTTISDGTVVIIFYLNCGYGGLRACRTLRDQFVAALEYSAPPGIPDLKLMR